MARPKRLELLTPRFVGLGSTLEIIEVRSRKLATDVDAKRLSEASRSSCGETPASGIILQG